MASKANIIVDQGSTFETYLEISDDQGIVVDLTGYTTRGQIRKWYTSSAYIDISVSCPQPNNGIIFIGLNANTTTAMEAGRYVYDIEAVAIDHSVTRIVEGILTVTPEVTR